MPAPSGGAPHAWSCSRFDRIQPVTSHLAIFDKKYIS